MSQIIKVNCNIILTFFYIFYKHMYDQKYWKMYYLLHYRYNGFHLLVLFYIIFFFLQTLSYFIFPCIHTCFYRMYFLKMTISLQWKVLWNLKCKKMVTRRSLATSRRNQRRKTQTVPNVPLTQTSLNLWAKVQ